MSASYLLHRVLILLSAFMAGSLAGQTVIKLSEPPEDARMQSMVHFVSITGDTKNPEFSLWVPHGLRAEYEALSKDDDRWKWLAKRFQSQAGIRGNHDLGLLVLHGLGLKADRRRAKELMLPGIPYELREGPRRLAWQAVTDAGQPEATRDAFPLILELLTAGDWWSLWAALQAWDHLRAADTTHDRELLNKLRPAAKQVLQKAFLSPPEDREMRGSLENNADEWCYRLLVMEDAEALRDLDEITLSWTQMNPGDVGARVRRLGAHFYLQRTDQALALALELIDEGGLKDDQLDFAKIAKASAAVESGRYAVITRSELLALFDWSAAHWAYWLLFGLTAALVVMVPLLTRFRRQETPSWWLCLLWIFWPICFSSSLLLPMWAAVPTALLAITLLIYGITGPRSLGYMRGPQSHPGRWWRMVGVCVLAYFGLMIFVEGYARLYAVVIGRPLADQMVMALLHGDGFLSWLSGIFIAAMCVPLAEEVVFRGLLQDWLSRRMRLWLACLLSAATFGFIHGLDYALPVTVIGLVASWLRFHYSSLWPCILLHSITNGVIVTTMHLSGA